MKSAVDVRSKFDPLFSDLPQLLHTEYLIAAGIRQDGAVPAHERVEPPHFLYDFHPRPEVEMVRVTQDQLRPQLLEVLTEQCFDGALSPNRGKDRCIHRTMRGMDPPGPRFTTGASM